MVAGGVQAASSLVEEGRAAGWAASMRAVSLLPFLFLSAVLLRTFLRSWSPFASLSVTFSLVPLMSLLSPFSCV